MSLWQILVGVLLSATPFFELRGGIPLMLATGVSIKTAFFLGVLSNILIIPVIFLFLDYFHHSFMRIGFYNRLFDKKLNKVRTKYSHKVASWPFFGLWFLVAIPIPTTGVYTAGLLAWFFELNRRKSFLSMALGVICAGILVSLVYTGVVSLIW